MSDNLSKAIDRFLSYTDIHSHHYGVPKWQITSFSSGYRASAERKYTENYHDLMHNLEQVSYQHELKQLSSMSAGEIDQEYEDMLRKLPLNGDGDVDAVIKELNHFKTESILNQYLQYTVPILRSIHSKDSNFTASEVNITNNLALVFSKVNEMMTTNVNALKSEYNKKNDLTSQLADTHKILEDLYLEITPHLKEIDSITTKIKDAKAGILSRQIDYTRVDNEKQLRNKFSKLMDNWSKIVSLSNFLPSFIMCLPIDWYDDKICLSVIKQCGKISEQFDSYLRLVGKDDIKNMNLDDFIAIHLEKLAHS